MIYAQFSKLTTPLPVNSFNIYNVRDFLAGTYQHQLNVSSVTRTPEKATAFIENSSIVEFGIMDFFDADLLQSDSDCNLDQVDIDCNTCIHDIDGLTIIDSLNFSGYE